MQSFFPRDVLDEILNSIESVSEGFPTYSCFCFLRHAVLIVTQMAKVVILV